MKRGDVVIVAATGDATFASRSILIIVGRAARTHLPMRIPPSPPRKRGPSGAYAACVGPPSRPAAECARGNTAAAQSKQGLTQMKADARRTRRWFSVVY